MMYWTDEELDHLRSVPFDDCTSLAVARLVKMLEDIAEYPSDDEVVVMLQQGARDALGAYNELKRIGMTEGNSFIQRGIYERRQCNHVA